MNRFQIGTKGDGTWSVDVGADDVSALSGTPAADVAPDQDVAAFRGRVREALQPHLGSAAELGAVERLLLDELDDLAETKGAQGEDTLTITAANEEAALRLAASLSHITPAHGLSVLSEWIVGAKGDPALAYAALPFIRSLHERPGSEWTGNSGLRRAADLLHAIVASGVDAQGGAALAEISEVRSELQRFVSTLKEQPGAFGWEGSGTGGIDIDPLTGRTSYTGGRAGGAAFFPSDAE